MHGGLGHRGLIHPRASETSKTPEATETSPARRWASSDEAPVTGNHGRDLKPPPTLAPKVLDTIPRGKASKWHVHFVQRT